jgi:hypothetical protein
MKYVIVSFFLFILSGQESFSGRSPKSINKRNVIKKKHSYRKRSLSSSSTCSNTCPGNANTLILCDVTNVSVVSSSNKFTVAMANNNTSFTLYHSSNSVANQCRQKLSNHSSDYNAGNGRCPNNGVQVEWDILQLPDCSCVKNILSCRIY